MNCKFIFAAFIILIGAALGMATVVFQPNDEIPELPDVDYIVTNNDDVITELCTASSMIASSSSKHGKQCTSELEEKQDVECPEFLPEQKLTSCTDCACASSSNQSGCNSVFCPSNDVAPINFTEEIQKLLHGEELQFIDDCDE